MIKEMGIRILERVNEMLPVKKRIIRRFLKGGFSISKVGTEQLEDVRCDHTMHLGHVATFSSMI